MTSHLVIIEVLVIGLIEKDTYFVELFEPKDLYGDAFALAQAGQGIMPRIAAYTPSLNI
jgi:hypothetical protein